jgi:hypothetical protein
MYLSLDDHGDIGNFYVSETDMPSDPDGTIFVKPSSNTSGVAIYLWALRQGQTTKTGRGKILSSAGRHSADLSTALQIIFDGERTAYLDFIKALSPDEVLKCRRTTFDKDCRLASAENLYEEQNWCEAAYRLDSSASGRRGYIVKNIGTERYFGYFNFKSEPDDSFNLKSCHNLRKWANLYIPEFYAKHDVGKWVFLEPDVFVEFCKSAPRYKAAFELKELNFPPVG